MLLAPVAAPFVAKARPSQLLPGDMFFVAPVIGGAYKPGDPLDICHSFTTSSRSFPPISYEIMSKAYEDCRRCGDKPDPVIPFRLMERC